MGHYTDLINDLEEPTGRCGTCKVGRGRASATCTAPQQLVPASRARSPREPLAELVGDDALVVNVASRR